MRILITGGSGFLGARLVARLVSASPQGAAEGAEVYSLDRVPARVDAPGVTGLIVNLGAPLPPGVLPARVDAVAHLAAHVDPHAAAVELLEHNVVATQRLLDYARAAGARAFVYASTGGVYGYSPDPLREDAPIRPINLYSLTKYQAELLVRAAGGDLAAVVLRLFFPYGPGQRGRLVPGLFERIARGEPVTTYNGGANPVLNPIYVDDAVEALCRALARDTGDVVNVAGAEALPVRELARRIGVLAGRAPAYVDVTDAGQSNLVGDIGRLCDAWGCAPRVGLEEGLSRMRASVG